MGGGWCYDDGMCASRARGFLGSSTGLNATIDLNMIGVGAGDGKAWQDSNGTWHSTGQAVYGLLSDQPSVAGALARSHAVWLHYCDGSSWLSDRSSPAMVDGKPVCEPHGSPEATARGEPRSVAAQRRRAESRERAPAPSASIGARGRSGPVAGPDSTVSGPGVNALLRGAPAVLSPPPEGADAPALRKVSWGHDGEPPLRALVRASDADPQQGWDAYYLLPARDGATGTRPGSLSLSLLALANSHGSRARPAADITRTDHGPRPRGVLKPPP